MAGLGSLGISLPPLNLSAGGGHSDSGGSSASNPFEIPFSFDHSAFNVNIKGSGNQGAEGGGGAKTSGAAISAAAGKGANGLGGIGGGINLNYVLIGLALWLILKR